VALLIEYNKNSQISPFRAPNLGVFLVQTSFIGIKNVSFLHYLLCCGAATFDAAKQSNL
jgi:hypothetical protein